MTLITTIRGNFLIMEITFTGHQVDMGESLQEYMRDTLDQNVSKYFNEKEASSHVVISQQRGFFQVNIQVHIDKRVMVSAKGDGGDAYGAYHEALEHISKRLRRHKRRIKSHHHRGEKSNPVDIGRHYIVDPQMLESEQEEIHEHQPLVIAENNNETETLSVSEAVAKLDMHALPFLLFRDIKNSKINLIYQREDGNIGWIDP